METSAVHDQIRMLLIQDFKPVFIEVTDDSARHHGHPEARSGGRARHGLNKAELDQSPRPGGGRARHGLNKAELDQSPRPGGGGSHFRVKMAVDSFKGQTLIQRHQAVYRALESFLQSGVHALQMELLSAEEWHARGPG